MVVLRLSLLGLIKANRPELAPRFFQTDLAPSIFGILKSLSRSDCEYLANRQMGTDCLLWTVLYSSLATGFMLRATMHLSGMLGNKCNKEHVCETSAHVIKVELILAVLALGAAIYTFCFLCLRVVWWGNFKGKHTSTVFITEIKRTEDID